MTEDREALEDACLEGLVLTPHGYRYKPALGADAVERVLAERLATLHRPSTDHGDGMLAYCVGCWEAGGMDGAPNWPCPTIRLVTTESA